MLLERDLHGLQFIFMLRLHFTLSTLLLRTARLPFLEEVKLLCELSEFALEAAALSTRLLNLVLH